MAELINLRRVKKRLAREADAAAADANRQAHGRTRLERAATAAARNQVDRVLDGARLEDTRSGGDREPGE